MAEMIEALIRARAPRNGNQYSDIGDIVVVREAGRIWSESEGLPEYLIVRVEVESLKAIKGWAEKHWEIPAVYQDEIRIVKPILVKRRMYRVPENIVTQLISMADENSIVEINLGIASKNFISNIIDKRVA